MLAEVLDPRPLHARVVLGRLDQVQEVRDVDLEPATKLRIGDLALSIEGAVGLGKGEHVWVEPGAEVLERDTQRPQPAVAAPHGR